MGISKTALLSIAMAVGVDIAQGPSHTVLWPSKSKDPDPKKRAKVKEARKQRNRK